MATRKILVVDDEDLLRWSVAEKLGEGGYEVVTAGDGATARSLIASGADLAVFDLRLPDADGMDLAREFHATRPEAPFIIMTAYETPETRKEAELLGAKGYLAKPFDFDELLIVVNKAIEESRS